MLDSTTSDTNCTKRTLLEQQFREICQFEKIQWCGSRGVICRISSLSLTFINTCLYVSKVTTPRRPFPLRVTNPKNQ